MIVCAYTNNIILTENNELYICGSNYSGQLGLGNNNNRNVYTKLEHNLGKIRNISIGKSHNIILNENNELYVCGSNYSSQLGLCDYENRNVYTYTKLENNFGKIKNIHCGSYHNIILNENNEIFVVGNNSFGQLGLGDNNDRNVYTKLEHNFGKIKYIYCGAYHNIILNENNELFVCGDNMRGQLGLGDNKNRNTYTKIKHNFGKIKNIYCGENHNIILNENNELYVCGFNHCGQLGLGDKKDRNVYTKLEHNFGKIKNICCGDFHNIIFNENNELYVCGYNYRGQLGLGDYYIRYTYTNLEHNLGEIKNIYCCENYSIILNDDNEIYVCGDNIYGQLGLGDYKNRSVYTKLDLPFDIFNKKPIGHLLELNLGEIII
jgi:alpha-tubulin suppressor-like RCC1 family protein